MVTASHDVPRIDSGRAEEGLSQTFSDFISASAQLELTYRDLQAQIATLHLRLVDQGQALQDSVSEKESLASTMRSTLESLPCGVLVVEEAAIQWANPEAARLLGLLAAQLPQDVQQQDRVLDLDVWLHQILALPCGARREQEWSFRSAAGPHWLSLRYVDLPGVRGTYSNSKRALVILEDQTLRRRLELERASARDDETLGKIASLLAHEIRNPLASMELFADLLQDDPVRSTEWLSHLRAGIRSLSGTVNNVLALNGSAALELQPLELTNEMATAVRFLQPLARQAHVRLSTTAPPAELMVWANKDAVHQILLNLIGNALRFSPADGAILLSCFSQETCIRLEVSDNGPGIAEADQHRVFESGFSGSGSRPGLGLTVCERLMQQQGGSIHVQSRLGNGTVFALEFRRA